MDTGIITLVGGMAKPRLGPSTGPDIDLHYNTYLEPEDSYGLGSEDDHVHKYMPNGEWKPYNHKFSKQRQSRVPKHQKFSASQKLRNKQLGVKAK